MQKLELLAPAKNLECGIAAIDHGADAVYIGPERFGARVAAGNPIEDIRQLCDYAHQYRARVYATVNTIIYDDELSDTEELLWQLYQAGIDAILVQDMGLLRMKLPPIALHASTQTDNRTADKVHWLQELGFQRVVLARELSVSEIADIHRQVPDMPLEVFVHGALCVSYSGQCYASQHCFARSANRGACAQVCRMEFDLTDDNGNIIEHNRHLLSLKDLNLSEHLEELAAAGATSFKIEGRLKDITYVKNVTAAYSDKLNELIGRHPDKYQRASLGHCTYSFRPNLKKTFNRGFTTYFLHGRQPDIYSPDTPKAMGEFVGTVKELRGKYFTVAGTARFANGDGLCYLYLNNHVRTLKGFRVNRAEGNRLFPQQMPDDLRPGMSLYRNNDTEFERQLSRPSSERKIPIMLHFDVLRDDGTEEGFTLRVTDTTNTLNGSFTFHLSHQLARTSQRENIIRELSKLGGTPFTCTAFNIAADFPYFIPNSRLSEMRRTMVTHLLKSGATCNAPFTIQHEAARIPAPSYQQHYLYNIANQQAAAFYHETEPTAYELKGGKAALLMQCRHCLRYSLGYCTRRVGKKPSWHEPLSLQLSNGRKFLLEFDCKNCQMNIYAKQP